MREAVGAKEHKINQNVSESRATSFCQPKFFLLVPVDQLVLVWIRAGRASDLSGEYIRESSKGMQGWSSIGSYTGPTVL